MTTTAFKAPSHCPSCGAVLDFTAVHFLNNIYECACSCCHSNCIILVNDSIVRDDDLDPTPSSPAPTAT